MIAKQLPGRTDNDVKNYWNTKLRKKLFKMGIDPVTHKPFSQIFTDYGNISGLPNNRNRIGSPNNFINNRAMSLSEPYLAPTELSNTKTNNMPMIEQFQDIPFTNNHLWDNVAPFQVINQEMTIQPHCFNEISSSTSSSSSCSVTLFKSSPQSFSCQPSQVQMAPSSPSTWNEFLLGDPFLSTDLIEAQQECKPQGILSTINPSVSVPKETPHYNFISGNESNLNDTVRHDKAGTFYYEPMTGDQTKNCSEATSSAVDSFVEAILDRDSEMQLEFPELLEGNFDY